jgi:hypothetical protein
VHNYDNKNGEVIKIENLLRRKCTYVKSTEGHSLKPHILYQNYARNLFVQGQEPNLFQTYVSVLIVFLGRVEHSWSLFGTSRVQILALRPPISAEDFVIFLGFYDHIPG